MLEKYKSVLDNSLTALGRLEFEDAVTVEDVLKSLQRIEMVLRVAAEIEGYICELGTEGRLVKMQLTELIDNVEDEEFLEAKVIVAKNRDGACGSSNMNFYPKLTKFVEVA